MARPSRDRMTAWPIWATLVTRSLRSQSSSLVRLTGVPLHYSRPAAGERGSLVAALLAAIPAWFRTQHRLRQGVRLRRAGAAELPASLQRRHRTARRLRRWRAGDLVGGVGGQRAGLAQLRGQAGLANPDRQ